jgi:hypothetical protein
VAGLRTPNYAVLEKLALSSFKGGEGGAESESALTEDGRWTMAAIARL